MRITRSAVDRVADLARLEFNDEEAEHLTGQMNTILDYIDKLNELNTAGVEPTSHTIPDTNTLRSDEPKRVFAAEDALANAPCSEERHFKVPRVIE